MSKSITIPAGVLDRGWDDAILGRTLRLVEFLQAVAREGDAMLDQFRTMKIARIGRIDLALTALETLPVDAGLEGLTVEVDEDLRLVSVSWPSFADWK